MTTKSLVVALATKLLGHLAASDRYSVVRYNGACHRERISPFVGLPVDSACTRTPSPPPNFKFPQQPFPIGKRLPAPVNQATRLAIHPRQ